MGRTMAISLADIKHSIEMKPPRIVVHGVGGIGKTTFAAGAPNPIFICTEDGLGVLDVPHFPIARTYDDVIGALEALLKESHQFETAVIDSVDHFEPMIWDSVCKDQGWKSIEEPGYGKGYIEAMTKWREYINLLDDLRDKRGMTVIQIVHTLIKRFNNPESEPYDRYIINLQERASSRIRDTSDVVLFANYKVLTVKTDVGFNKKIVRGKGEGDRVIYTSERPAFIAKNRYNLPHELPLSWEDFIAAFPKGQK